MKLLIIGDSIIDKNVYVDAIGLSLESPTLKSNFRYEQSSFGGAASVAILASKFGADVTFVSSMSEEYRLIFSYQHPEIKLKLLSDAKNIKSRFYVSRGDNEYKYLQINDVNRNELNTKLNFDLSKYSKIAISDYRCGLINSDIVKTILHSHAVTFAASQESDLGSNLNDYKEFDFIVCNKKESKSLNRTHNVVVTKGKKGASFNGVCYAAKNIDDQKVKTTIGAGDCFYASYLVDNNIKLANERASKFILGKL